MKSRAEHLADAVDTHAASIEVGETSPVLDAIRLRALAAEIRQFTSRDLYRSGRIG